MMVYCNGSKILVESASEWRCIQHDGCMCMCLQRTFAFILFDLFVRCSKHVRGVEALSLAGSTVNIRASNTV